MAIHAFNQLDKDLDVTVEDIFKGSSLSDHVYSAMTVEERMFISNGPIAYRLLL